MNSLPFYPLLSVAGFLLSLTAMFFAFRKDAHHVRLELEKLDH